MSNSYQCMYVIPKEQYKSLLTPTLNSVSSDSQSTPYCGKTFKHPNILAHHEKSHVDGFKCNICGKVFTNESNLKKHLSTHATETLQCKVCGKQSKYKRNFERHALMHKKKREVIKFNSKKWETLQ